MALVLATGCATTKGMSNAELRESYYHGAYDDMVTAENQKDGPASSDAAISVRALEALEMEIASGAAPAVEGCVESEMDRLQSPWVAGSFSFEVHVESTGKVSKAKLIEHDVQERRVPAAEARSASEFGPCVEQELLALEMDPIVDRTYVHTYVGFVGEAW